MDMKRANDKNNLILTIKQSTSEEKDLFDNENICKEETIRIDSSGVVVLKKDFAKFISLSLEDSSENSTKKEELVLCKDESSLVSVNVSPKNNFYINSKITNSDDRLSTNSQYSSQYSINSNINSENLIWRVVAKEKNANKISNSVSKANCSLLTKHDIIKFGKLKLFVSDIINFEKFTAENYYSQQNINDESFSLLHNSKNLFEKVNHMYLKVKECEKESAQCRVCYSKETSEENPLVSVCNCTGSVKFIHYLCLETWISTRTTFKEKPNLIIVKCKMYCELCKSPLPTRFTYENKLYKLIESQFVFEENTRNLVLESIDFKSKDYFQYFYIISVFDEKREISVGRNKNCDVRLKESHTCEIHASIICRDNQFYIYDKKSRYGTLILEKQSVKIDQNLKSLQINNIQISSFVKINSQVLHFDFDKIFLNTNLSSNYLSEQFDNILSKIKLTKKEQNENEKLNFEV